MKNGWYHWAYAVLMRQFETRYEPLVAARKRVLLAPLRGTVLEIGPGTGSNLLFLSNDVRWVGVEPNPHMARYVETKAARLGLEAKLSTGLAEQLPADDESVDAVICSLVLCCVKDPTIVVAEALRVLKPDGRFVFLEHVAAPRGSSTRRRQERIRPVWQRLADGCHPDRETWRTIESAGFRSVELEHFRLNLPLAGPHIAGVALK